MKEKNMLCLKAGAALTQQEHQIGVVLGGKTRLARDALQESLLHKLAQSGRSVEALQAEICAARNAPPDSPEIALLLAAFILDFSDFLDFLED